VLSAIEGFVVNEAKIVCDPSILCGKPTIAGTRISVELVLEELGSGVTMDEFLQDYSHITREQVLAALRFAAQAIRSDAVYPFVSNSA
jgi:uncharacterized protein (DUF433 family)